MSSANVRSATRRGSSQGSHDERLGDFDARSERGRSPEGEQPHPRTWWKPRARWIDQLEVGPHLRGPGEVDPVARGPLADEGERVHLYDLRQRGISRLEVALEIWIDEAGDLHSAPRRRDRDRGPPRSVWLDTDERAACSELLPGSVEGMNHAPERDSSKRPAEERNVEGWAAVR